MNNEYHDLLIFKIFTLDQHGTLSPSLVENGSCQKLFFWGGGALKYTSGNQT